MCKRRRKTSGGGGETKKNVTHELPYHPTITINILMGVAV